MYEILIKEYLKRLSLKDINEFANKNAMPLLPSEDKIIYDFIMKNWKEVYYKNDINVFNELKEKLSENTYSNILILYKELDFSLET